VVTQPGTYKIAATIFLGGNTTLIFGNGVFLKKVDEQGPFTHVLLNKGALTKTFDQCIAIEGLHLIVNTIDPWNFDIYGLRGQIAFFYIKDLRIERFRCLDLGKAQYAVHVCTFEDIIIKDVIIKGEKDGVHLGRGKRFTICNGVFQTFDDAVALNAYDYADSNPESGWIEDGVVEKCYDLNDEKTTGFFCRILAGAWIDWQPGMEVQHSDSVVSDGRIYRVRAKPDGTVYKSMTQPTHKQGTKVLDGIPWGATQNEATYTAGVRNVMFRDIILSKPRIGFAAEFCHDHYCRSYYSGAIIPVQEKLFFDNVRVTHDQPIAFLSINTPVDVMTITYSSIKNNPICFESVNAMPKYPPTKINIVGCVFGHEGPMDVVTNSGDGKEILLKTSASIEVFDGFTARVMPGNGHIEVASDLTGLKA
jgi:hypothetical protein